MPHSKGFPCTLANRINKTRSNLLSVKERRIRQDLVKIRPVRLAELFRGRMPPRLVQFGKVSLVLGVHHYDRSASSYNDVGHEVT